MREVGYAARIRALYAVVKIQKSACASGLRKNPGLGQWEWPNKIIPTRDGQQPEQGLSWEVSNSISRNNNTVLHLESDLTLKVCAAHDTMVAVFSGFQKSRARRRFHRRGRALPPCRPLAGQQGSKPSDTEADACLVQVQQLARRLEHHIPAAPNACQQTPLLETCLHGTHAESCTLASLPGMLMHG